MNRLYALLLGFMTISVQIVFIREFFTIFYGNELCYGIVLAGWMFWVALGSLLGHHIQSLANRSVLFFITLIVVLVLFDLILLKFVRYILNVPYGEFISITGLVIFSFLILALPCFSMGLFYSRLSAQSADHAGLSGDPSAFVYGWEAAGSVVASLVLTYFLITVLPPIPLVMMLYLVSLLLLYLYRRDKALLGFAVTTAVVWVLLSAFSLQTRLNEHYWHSIGKGMELVTQRQSHYGQLSIIEWGGEAFLYNNGIKQTALYEAVDNQALAALILTQNASPKDLLLIGGGLGGLAPELAKPGEVQLDYIEQDKIAHKLVQARLPDSLQKYWKQPDLHIFFTDGRDYLRQADKRYDIIAVNVGSPMSAQENRYYTVEFFQVVRNHLKPNGILAICNFPSSADYLGPELLQLNASLYQTLKTVFDHILICPGVSAHYFAANASASLTFDLDVLQERYANYSYQYFFPQLFYQYFLPERIAYVSEKIKQAPFLINRDFHPISYFFDLVLWYKIIRTKKDILQISDLPFSVVLGGFSALAAGWLLFTLAFAKRRKTWAGGIFIATVLLGVASIGLNVILIISFQMSFGALYHYVGIAIASYMAGTALGSLWVNRYLHRWGRNLFLLFLFLLLFLLLALKSILMVLMQHPSYSLYYFLIVVTGILLGTLFPFLCREYTLLRRRRQPGSIYAADLIGASAGALLVSTLLIPLYGIASAILILALVVFVTALFLFLRKALL